MNTPIFWHANEARNHKSKKLIRCLYFWLNLALYGYSLIHYHFKGVSYSVISCVWAGTGIIKIMQPEITHPSASSINTARLFFAVYSNPLVFIFEYQLLQHENGLWNQNTINYTQYCHCFNFLNVSELFHLLERRPCCSIRVSRPHRVQHSPGQVRLEQEKKENQTGRQLPARGLSVDDLNPH